MTSSEHTKNESDVVRLLYIADPRFFETVARPILLDNIYALCRWFTVGEKKSVRGRVSRIAIQENLKVGTPPIM